MEDIDIGMFFLNAGTLTYARFSELPSEEMENMINVNILHSAYLVHAILP